MDDDAARWEAVEEAAELLLEGAHEEALTLLRAAIAGDPKNAYAYFHSGNALYELERYAGAVVAFRSALALSPDYAGARLGLAHALRKVGEPAEALRIAMAGVTALGEDSDHLYAAALAAAATGERALATELLRRFLATGPELEAQLEAQGQLDALAQGDGPLLF